MGIGFGSLGISNDYYPQFQNHSSALNPSVVSKTPDASSNPIKPTSDIKPSGIQPKERAGQVECETCNNRKYQDVSNDSGVSFKTAGHIDPGSSAAVVMSHEQEHVSHEQAKARSEGRKVISQSVKLETSSCSECGRSYVSGGLTTTVTKTDTSKNKADTYNRQMKKAVNDRPSKSIDLKI